jgi:hypothetical protein
MSIPVDSPFLIRKSFGSISELLLAAIRLTRDERPSQRLRSGHRFTSEELQVKVLGNLEENFLRH